MNGPGDARTRTMAHMQRLLATVAAAGAAASAGAQEPSPGTAPVDSLVAILDTMADLIEASQPPTAES